MADATDDEKLRQMAEHRGLKLVKSRKRKPGTGDYGRYGLTDAAGKTLLGIAEAGLTATAEDIEAYLRAGATSTWKTSADTTPRLPARSATTAKAAPDKIEPAIRRKPTSAGAAGQRSAGERRAIPDPAPAPQLPKAEPKVVTPKPKPEPAPQLAIRPARPSDAGALGQLLRQLVATDIDTAEVARNLAAIGKARGGMAVAERAGLVGCCAWVVIPTLQHGPVGRLTVMIVDERHRRRGIATALLAAATAALQKAGCTVIEAMNDIEVRNAHGFFRTLKFEQTSYRFARPIDPS